MKVVCFIALALLGASVAATRVDAEDYRWVDENGTIHISRSPPAAGAKAQRVERIVAPPGAGMVGGAVQREQPPEPAAVECPVPAPVGRSRGERVALESDEAEGDADEVAGEDAEADEESDEDAGDVAEEDGEDDSDSTEIIVDDGSGDLKTKWRSRSPRNEPGQPIRQPGDGGGAPRPAPRGRRR